jgi:hypothetical protein
LRRFSLILGLTIADHNQNETAWKGIKPAALSLRAARLFGGNLLPFAIAIR